jgi:maltose-binding protein MalE
MKSLGVFLTIILLSAFSISVSAQSGTKTAQLKSDTFKVWGKCDMCKERIETTAKTAGAATASWKEETQMLTVTFDPAKTSRDDLSKKIAAVGHDTEKFKAPDEAYAKLPGCCHYDRAK